MSGYQYNEKLGKIHFWLTFIGVNVLFLPMHVLGLAGMPRRIPDYPDAFSGWNFVVSIGGYISIFAALFFFYVVYRIFKDKMPCPDNPWGSGADTLEWSVSSPPPFHTFEKRPTVQ
jgi:cytochrome c oxidase subunit 1